MGVNKLWSILEKASRLVRLETLSGKILAVDASIWIYQFFKAFRDKEGNYISNGHILGFFRRICKLLFFGIKPIFVFDGNVPFLKKHIIKKRKERRLKCEEDSVKLAEKIFSLQMKKTLEKEVQEKRQENKSKIILKESPYFESTKSLSENIKVLKENKHKDIYDLPNISLPFEKIRQSGDFRIMNQENNQDYMQNFTSDDLNSLDFSKIDFDSEFFKSLSLADQYNILNMARLKSRLRMGLSVYELMMMFPDSMEFSKFQINRVKERNDLTQRLLNFNGIDKTGRSRVIGEPNKEYLLIKNEDTKPGWTLNFDSMAKKDVINDKNDESCYENEEFEDIPLYNMDLDLKDQEQFLNNSFKKEISRKMENNIIDSQINDKKNSPLFLISDDSDISEEYNEYYIKENNNKKIIIEELDHKRNTKSNNCYLEFITKDKDKNNSQSNLCAPRLSNIISKRVDFENIYSSEENNFLNTSKNEVLGLNDISKTNIISAKDVTLLNNILLEENSENSLKKHKSYNKGNLHAKSPVDTVITEEEIPYSNKLEDYICVNNSKINNENNEFVDKIDENSVENVSFQDENLVNKVDLETNKSISSSLFVTDKFSKMNSEIIDCPNLFKKKQEMPKDDAFLTKNTFDIIDDNDYDSSIENDVLIKQILEENEEHSRFFSKLNNSNEHNGDYFEELDLLMDQYKKNKKASDSITQIIIEECQVLLKLFGIPYITAYTEAEAQCAELVKLGLADGIITDDSDIFLFGGTKVYRNMFNHSKYVELYLLSDMELKLNLNRKKLINLAHLLGSDYTEGVPKIGPITALEILSEFPEPDNLNKFKEWCNRVKNFKETDDDKTSNFKRKFRKNINNVLFLQDFPNPLVDKAYLEPEVDSSLQQFEWGVPDLDNLRDFLKSTIGWPLQKINEMIIPVIKNMNLKRANEVQTNLTDYLFTNSINTFNSQRTKKNTKANKNLNNLKKSKKTSSNKVKNKSIINV
ncbi:hypothetical protein PORY_002732 [Pneumocystis oryctolagi]|uniref:Uncharacterized protein n=1 Tax=Pneumocystis oryctolagi TaxID=42067 RepID=A0ACB7CAE6_9ASCO|nr:hypothetical protein PORY_002732 [Pneumocystis oryctolagi]